MTSSIPRRCRARRPLWSATARRLLTALLGIALISLVAACDALPASPVASPPPGATPGAVRTVTPTAAVTPRATGGAAASLAGTPSPTAAPLLGRVRIPALGIDAPIVSVSWRLEEVDGQVLGAWDTAEGAAGHHVGTTPLGGPGNCVLSGHSRADRGGVFDGLEALRAGDLVTLLDAAGLEHRYVVDRVDRLPEHGADLAARRAHAAAMAPTEDARLTLITCWPPWAYTHRVVVVARPELPS